MTEYLNIDFENIEHDNEEKEKLKQYFSRLTENRNNIYYSVFRKYEPLFRLDTTNDTQQDQYSELCAEYFTLINPYKEVRVLDDATGKVMMTLPAILNRTNSVDTLGKSGIDIDTAFSNANKIIDTFDSKKMKYSEIYKHVFHLAQDAAQVAKNREHARTIAAAIVENKPVDKVSDSTIKSKSFKTNEIEDLGDMSNDSSSKGEEEVEYL